MKTYCIEKITETGVESIELMFSEIKKVGKHRFKDKKPYYFFIKTYNNETIQISENSYNHLVKENFNE